MKDEVRKEAIHARIIKQFGKPQLCEICGRNDSETIYHWSNKDHKYNEKRENWQRLCAKCHAKYDIENNRKKYTLTCVVCGELFEALKALQLCCSRSCMKTHRIAKRKAFWNDLLYIKI